MEEPKAEKSNMRPLISRAITGLAVVIVWSLILYGFDLWDEWKSTLGPVLVAVVFVIIFEYRKMKKQSDNPRN